MATMGAPTRNIRMINFTGTRSSPVMIDKIAAGISEKIKRNIRMANFTGTRSSPVMIDKIQAGSSKTVSTNKSTCPGNVMVTWREKAPSSPRNKGEMTESEEK